MSVGKLFLSAVIKSGNRNYLNRVKDELFYNKPVSGDMVSELDMLTYIRRHILQYRTIPTHAVLQSSGMPYMETDQPVEYYITELKKRAVYNSFKNFTRDITPVVTQNFDLDRAYELINIFSNQVSLINTADRYRSVTELGRDIETEIEGRKNGTPEIFIPFGWPTLDSITGGASGGDLIYNVARPGTGKTTTLVFNARTAWKAGFKPLLVTNEMTDLQIARRLYGLEGQFNPDSIRRGIPDSEVERRLGSAITSFEGGIPFYIVSGNTRQTVDTITALVDELNPDVVYIDAAYLLKMNGPAKILWEKLLLLEKN
jgi:replicative DNA helicase